MSSPRRSWQELQFLFSSRQGLPPVPEPALRLTTIVADSDFSAARAEEAILADPGLTTSILKVAQSAAYAQRQPVTSVRQAILVLGARQLRNLAASLMTMAVISKGHHRSMLPLNRLSEAGMKIGKSFAALSSHHDASAYSCGVLSQTPAGFLSLVDPATFDSAWTYARESRLSLESAFYAQHGQPLYALGALALTSMGIPENLVVPVEALGADQQCPLALIRRAIDLIGHGTTPWPMPWPESFQHPEILDVCTGAVGLGAA
jgi:hypothetical protein